MGTMATFTGVSDAKYAENVSLSLTKMNYAAFPYESLQRKKE